MFSPEFRNRLDAIVSFGPLTPAVMETIVEKFILQLEAQLAERRVAITLEPEARAWLAEKGFDPVYGARPLARVIQTEVRDPLTDEILFGRLEGGGTVTIALKDGKRCELRATEGVRRQRRRRPSGRAEHSRGRVRSSGQGTCQTSRTIPVKVVDRRWWANADTPATPSATSASTSLKPTYVEELEQQVAEKDKQIQEYLAKYRQASTEFEETRLRLRREISKDIERARREILVRAARGRRQPRSRDRGRPPVVVGRRAAAGRRDGAPPVPQQARRARRQADRVDAARTSIPTLHEAVTTVPAASPDQDGMVVGIIRHGYRIGDDVLRPAAVAVAKA